LERELMAQKKELSQERKSSEKVIPPVVKTPIDKS
jgi:hypothetical protein